MKKTIGFKLEEETIKKICFIARDKSQTNSNYITSLVEEDWLMVIHNSPFAEALIKDLKKEAC